MEAGADVTVKNDAGHDAVFLAERAAWTGSAEEEEEGRANENEGQTQEVEMTVSEGDAETQDQQQQTGAGEMSAGRQVVEWLLSSEKAAGLESGGTEGEGSA